MTDENAILSSQSITEFIDNVNQFYQLDWPVTFSESSLIWRLWIIMVTVQNGTDADSYTVEGEFDFLSSQSPAKVRITAKNLSGGGGSG